MSDNDQLFGKKEETTEIKKEVDLKVVEYLEKALVLAKEGVIGDFLITYQDRTANSDNSFPLYMKILDEPEKLNIACDYAKREIMDYLLGISYGDEDD